jgi:hypothetical protein
MTAEKGYLATQLTNLSLYDEIVAWFYTRFGSNIAFFKYIYVGKILK